jgi:transposase
MQTTAQFPDDIDALKALVSAQWAEVQALREERDGLKQSKQDDKYEIQRLTLLLAKLQRMMFGQKSEKLLRQIDQLELELEELHINQGERASVVDVQESSTRHAPRRRALPEHLPHDIHEHLPDAVACPDCGGAWKKLGEDVSEVLEYLPASFRVMRHVRPRLACTCCDRMAQAPAPSRPIARSFVGPGLLAHVIVSKYADHTPLYRQCRIYEREHVELSESTLADLVGGVHRLFEPLIAALRDHVFGARKLHTDDTPVAVLMPGKGKTQQARLWTYVRDDRPSGGSAAAAVWFRYSPDRKGIQPQTHLKHFSGILQADAFAGYNAVYETGRVIEAACWAHARRKFFDIHEHRPTSMTEHVLEQVAALYRIEAEIRGRR